MGILEAFKSNCLGLSDACEEVRRVQRSHSLPSGVTLTIIDSQPASKVRGGERMDHRTAQSFRKGHWFSGSLQGC